MRKFIVKRNGLIIEEKKLFAKKIVKENPVKITNRSKIKIK